MRGSAARLVVMSKFPCLMDKYKSMRLRGQHGVLAVRRVVVAHNDWSILTSLVAVHVERFQRLRPDTGVDPTSQQLGQIRNERDAAPVVSIRLNESWNSIHGSDHGLAVGCHVIDPSPLADHAQVP